MKLELKEFQSTCVDRLLKEAGFARAEVSAGGKAQTLILASPTGSGKTVIATAFIESVIAGDDDWEADPEATFLWISYQPDLNEQTRRKMLETSSLLTEDDLVTIGSDFKAHQLEPGRVHFVNAQKLGQDKHLVSHGEGRTHTFWETVNNTAKAAPASFYVIIDEAHKGMRTTGPGSTTIMQKFVLPDADLDPIGLVVGISATPQRFQEALAGPHRNTRPVEVDPNAVRDSGLLKDRVTLYHPSEAGEPADFTLLEQAAERLAHFASEWMTYADQEAQPPVNPILVVQVEDAKAGKPTATDLEALLTRVETQMGDLEDEEIAHAFQEGSPLAAGNRSIRYVAPADIQDDQDIRLVLFKQSLNTGWDCPRAEVMMSFRRAKDRTHIAQLIGRMVRTPLARRIEATELLNSVALYLPRFDAAAVKEVVEYLTDPDGDHTLIPDTVLGADLVDCERVDLPELVVAYEDLPSMIIPRPNTWSDRKRLLKLSRALSLDNLEGHPTVVGREVILDSLANEVAVRRSEPSFASAVKAKRELVLESQEVEYAGTVSKAGQSANVALVGESVDAVFAAAGRALGNGLHVQYLHRHREIVLPPNEVKLELAIAIDDPSVLKAVDEACAAQVKDLLETHLQARKALPADRREAYAEIQRHAKEPEETQLALPEAIQARRGPSPRKKHLFVDANGRFPGILNKWESLVIDEEIKRDDVVGWLRNVDRKEWALCVDYEHEDRTRGLYPDLIVFREQHGGIVVDILDPHRRDLDDAWAKAKGLAKFAAKHSGDAFGRIEAIVVDSADTIRRIDLTDEKWRKKALKLTGSGGLGDLYDQAAE